MTDTATVTTEPVFAPFASPEPARPTGVGVEAMAVRRVPVLVSGGLALRA